MATPAGIGVWDKEFTNARQANAILAALPKVTDFTGAQAAAITGVVQTIKALNFMYLAETRDTLGIPVYAIVTGELEPPTVTKTSGGTSSRCSIRRRRGFDDAAGPIPLPVVLPAGFGAVGQTASPSTNAGSFAAFNRALAGKAGLELAYAVARNALATHPTPSTPGQPDVGALTRADSAITASALYDLGAIAPPVAGNFALDAHGVYHVYSGQSGDVQSPLTQFFVTVAPLYDLTADVDTAHDLRWKNKFAANPTPLQLPQYNPVAAPFLYVPYASVSSPEPILRAEELAIVRAQIRLGLGDFAGAVSLINTVHQQAGGFATPLSIGATYTAVRDSLLKEQRISTVLEGSADRAISIRMYGLEAVSDTTWQAASGPDAVAVATLRSQGTAPVDLHTTVSPVPVSTIQGAGQQLYP